MTKSHLKTYSICINMQECKASRKSYLKAQDLPIRVLIGYLTSVSTGSIQPVFLCWVKWQQRGSELRQLNTQRRQTVTPHPTQPRGHSFHPCTRGLLKPSMSRMPREQGVSCAAKVKLSGKYRSKLPETGGGIHESAGHLKRVSL